MAKLISLSNLSAFWAKVKAYFNPKIEALDTKIDKKTFVGTEAELQVAITQGLVDENTIIILTDSEDAPVYEFCTYADILALFPQYMTA